MCGKKLKQNVSREEEEFSKIYKKKKKNLTLTREEVIDHAFFVVDGLEQYNSIACTVFDSIIKSYRKKKKPMERSSDRQSLENN